MEYQKISEAVSEPFSENLKKLQELFPSVVKDGEVDFEALKEELGEFTEVGKKRYELTWAGKQDAQLLTGEPLVGKTLKYVAEESKNPETTENIYIEGDNLEALKLLQNSYRGKIKMIYIDPPYNTGKGTDFVYVDRYYLSKMESEIAEGARDEGGGRLVLNTETSARYHASWLSMMYPRLRLARDLLRDDGVIFISIDDNEVANLRSICDEIFGGNNFVSQIALVNNISGRSDSKNIATAHEYILIYQKSAAFFAHGMPLTETQLEEYKYSDDNGAYRLQGLRKRGSGALRTDRPNMWYPIYYSKDLNRVSLDEGEFKSAIKITPKLSDGTDGRWRWGIDTFEQKKHLLEVKIVVGRNEYDIYEKVYLQGDNGIKTTKMKSFLLDSKYTTDTATTEYKNLMEQKTFDSPKASALIQDLVVVGNTSETIILDFFSGSATTAHAVMQLNAEDGGNRKFIMIQLPEVCDEKSEAYKAGYPNICEIGKERIRRAGEKIKAENPLAELDVGFKVFKVDDTNIRWLAAEAGKQGITLEDALSAGGKDLRDFMNGTNDLDVVYEILIRQYGIPLTAPIELLSDIGERTYSIADTVIVCLEEDVTDSVIDKIANLEPIPQKIVFRDSAFGDNISLKENAMLRLDALMQKHAVGGRQPYSIEFL